MKMYCTNNNCPRAGWCKRVSLLRNMSEDTRTMERDNIQYMDPGTDYKCYVRNKAREIREREHINDILQDEESNRSEHEDSDREPRMWKDNRLNPFDDGGSQERCALTENWFRELQRSSDRRGEDASIGSTDISPENFRELQRIHQRIVELQNITRNGVPSSGFIAGQPDE